MRKLTNAHTRGWISNHCSLYCPHNELCTPQLVQPWQKVESQMTTESIILEINGLRHRVFVSGEGRPVLLLHGWPDSASLWRDVIPYFTARGYRTIAPDLRGFGEPTLPPRRTAIR